MKIALGGLVPQCRGKPRLEATQVRIFALRPYMSHSTMPSTAHTVPAIRANCPRFIQMKKQTANPSRESRMGNHCEPLPCRHPRTAEEILTPIKASNAP